MTDGTSLVQLSGEGLSGGLALCFESDLSCRKLRSGQPRGHPGGGGGGAKRQGVGLLSILLTSFANFLHSRVEIYL